jgi:hypothetical protein
MCTPLLVAIPMMIVSTALSLAQASAAAQAQGEANQRAVEQAAAKATAQGIQANSASRQRAGVEARQRFDVDKAAAAQSGRNITAASNQNIKGNYLVDVTQALNLSAGEQQSAITVQSLYAHQAARLGAANTAQSNLNFVDSLPRGGSKGLAIAGAVVGGISTGLSVYGAASDAGLGKGAGPGTDTFSYTSPSEIGKLSVPSFSSLYE